MGVVRMTHYYSQFGSDPKIEATFLAKGPQNADQIPADVRALLDKPGITQVAVLSNYGLGERIVIYQRLPELTTRERNEEISLPEARRQENAQVQGEGPAR